MATTQDVRPTRPRLGFGAGLADPGPLGLAGFAGTTFFLSVVNTNMLGTSVQTVVLGLALFYGGLAQLLAGMWEFAKGNTFGAVAFTSYGAFWMSFWYLLNHLPATAKPTDTLHAVGVYLLVWAIFTAYMTIAATRVSGAVLARLRPADPGFCGAGDRLAVRVTGRLRRRTATCWIHIGGWLGLLTALAAWYASFAGVANSTFKRVVLPGYAALGTVRP